MEKHYNFTEIERQMQELWQRDETYRFDKNAAGEIYSIDTPPPTVSGSLHIGHLFSYTQAEMIARFRRMNGHNVFYPFGFDDNGLPTERLVERDEGIRANALPRSEFAERCMNVAQKYEAEFTSLWKSLGFSVDWSLQYRTISPEVQKISQQLFLELAKSGKAYTKEAPVLWCTECQTSIAQAELDTADIDSTFNYIPFAVGSATLEVATTRPELLYGCVCLFVHPNDARYAKYIGESATVPLYNYEIPILSDEKVSIDKGTGVVMCATFGDSTDAEWYAQHNLPYRKIITPNGHIADDVPYIGGLKTIAARKQIIQLLQQKALLLKSETITHTVGIHERCGKETELIPSHQWYIDVLCERDSFLKAADEINWYPPQMKNRYIEWVENLKWDWCISRQRYFGVPFPLWYCADCGKPAFAEEKQLPLNPIETEYQGQCDCGCTQFTPERAVLDTWATSSITPQINARLGIPTSPMTMRTHAHEIIRTWTFYTIVRSLYHTGKIPWKDLMISGFILAKKGEKISKSKSNNALEPTALIAAHSADVLRYWAASAKLGTDSFFSPDELSIPKRFITKLWNACKFAISHLQDYNADATPDLLPIDRWILERASEATQKAAKLLYQYEVGSARHEIDELFWKDFCDNYLEAAKERLYRPDIHGAAQRASGQHALYRTSLTILKLYVIYVPHITEYIYQQFFKQHEKASSIYLLQWERPRTPDTNLLSFGDKLKEVLFDMRKHKSEHNLSMRAELERLQITTTPQFADWFAQSHADIKACSNAKQIVIITE